MRKEQKATKRCSHPTTFHPGRPFGLASVALLCALVPVAATHAQTAKPDHPSVSGETNRIRALTNSVLSPQSVVMTNPPATIPPQGPWEFSASDLQRPGSFIEKLVKQNNSAPHRFLWDHLSRETQTQLAATYAGLRKDTIRTPHSSGSELDPLLGGLKGLVGDLNTLVRGKSLFDEESFQRAWVSGNRISGDTLALTKSVPAGTNTARLNRLLLEDMFERDVVRRPKLLSDPATKELFVVDFKKNVLSLYTGAGRKLWSTEIAPSLHQLQTAGFGGLGDVIGGVLRKDDVVLYTSDKGAIQVDRKSGKVLGFSRL